MTLPAQDIVERLREPEFVTIDTGRLAADRIEAQGATISRLTADNEALGKELAESRAAHHRTSHKAVKRLRALWREKQAAEKRLAEVEANLAAYRQSSVHPDDYARLVSALRRQCENIERWMETGEPASSEESQSIYEQLKAALDTKEGTDAGE